LRTAARTNWNFVSARTANIQYIIYKPFEKNVNVYYQRLLTFVIFHNKRVYWRLLLFLDV